ncbi:hypothetical protein [Phenylobacterium sp. SCN 70-31]|uniref:hypothetical protein n=1 Tax=Phenylobacterium sp. SCN 70-31 TaxID=1660129 RepID=UPI0025FBBBF4|nr:hypothetical protein [Phenylobacterium sp. SCN 70-31]
MSPPVSIAAGQATGFVRAAAPARGRKLPVGVGLLAGAGVSAALWLGLIGGAMALLG